MIPSVKKLGGLSGFSTGYGDAHPVMKLPRYMFQWEFQDPKMEVR
jgi:hypothetical protein